MRVDNYFHLLQMENFKVTTEKQMKYKKNINTDLAFMLLNITRSVIYYLFFFFCT